MQEEIIINNVSVPIIKKEGGRWYPISYIGSKVLLKDLSPAQLRQNGYGKYFKEFKINFGKTTGGTLNTYCISEEGLKVILSNSKIGRLSVDQKKAMNGLLEYLGMELIIEDERFVKSISEKDILEYSEYIQDCIQDVLNENPNILWQRCGKCGKYYPYHVNFFRENPHAGNSYPLYTFCRDCKWTEGRSRDWIRRNDNELSVIYRKYDNQIYRIYKDYNIIEIYNHWIKSDGIVFPKIINNEKDKILIIKYCYENGYFEDYDDITSKAIYKICKFRVDGNDFIKRIQEELFGHYSKNGMEYIDDIETARKIFFKYLYNNNINIKEPDIYSYNYMELFKNSKIRGYYSRNGKCTLGLVMDLFENKYPAYKFNLHPGKYWDDKDHRVISLKHLIEEDMKIPLEKIPLYLTLENLRKNSSTLRNVARKYYKNNLWKWVNEVYPDKFIEEDFNIAVIRNVFDSAEEHVIHDILKSKFNNVIYNQRNSDNTITINHMQPDWFIFTNNGVWVVEYFGIDIEHGNYNERIDYYQKKTKSKLDRYKDMNWLGKIYLYPDDLKNNFKGLEEKLKVIV